MKSTRNSLMMSALALLLCSSMLIGTTFAWFTDSVTSSNNKIQSGTLELDLEIYKDGNFVSIRDNPQPIFDYRNWEPGFTDVKILKVQNEGTLALKWHAQFVSSNKLSALAEVIDVYVMPSNTAIAYPTDRDIVEGWDKVGTVKDFVNTIEQTTNGVLYPVGSTDGVSEAYLGIALKMQESAGNDYQGLDLAGNFDIRIYAAQLNAESDSFDESYDKLATFFGEAVVEVDPANLASAYHVDVTDNNTENNAKIGTLEVPKDALADGVTEIRAKMVPSEYVGNFTIATGLEKKVINISVEGLKEGNTVPVPTQVFVGENLDPATVKTYHYDDEITSTYNHETGYVSFASADYSPFTILYDAESVYTPEPALPENLPVANVVEAPEHVGVTLPWGNYGSWSPDTSIDPDPKLEAAYIFSCADTPEEASASDFSQWYCDFYVKLNRDLGENEIFLGGNYGSFGWIGFHNGDLTLPANTEIPLLGSVTSNPWSYADVANFVGTFTCGVGDVNDALADATFTVMLRLTNPENENEFYNVATVTHTFAKTVNTAQELQDAINDGTQNFVLGGDIDLSELGSLVIPAN